MQVWLELLVVLLAEVGELDRVRDHAGLQQRGRREDRLCVRARGVGGCSDDVQVLDVVGPEGGKENARLYARRAELICMAS